MRRGKAIDLGWVAELAAWLEVCVCVSVSVCLCVWMVMMMMMQGAGKVPLFRKEKTAWLGVSNRNMVIYYGQLAMI